MLRCRSCNNDLARDAESCPLCGHVVTWCDMGRQFEAITTQVSGKGRIHIDPGYKKTVKWFLLANAAVIVTLFFTTAATIGIQGVVVVPVLLVMGATVPFGTLLMSKWLVKRAHKVKTISAHSRDAAEIQLYNMVDGLRQRAGLEVMPEVGIYESEEMNAFATGATRKSAMLAYSTALLSRMDEDEIAAVTAHEIAHIANGDMITLSLIQAVVNAVVLLFYIPLSTLRFLAFFIDDLDWIIVAILTVIRFVVVSILLVLGTLVVYAFSRRREFEADRIAAELLDSNAMIKTLRHLGEEVSLIEYDKSVAQYAALKISSPLSALGDLFSTHPSVDRRINALELRHAALMEAPAEAAVATAPVEAPAVPPLPQVVGELGEQAPAQEQPFSTIAEIRVQESVEGEVEWTQLEGAEEGISLPVEDGAAPLRVEAYGADTAPPPPTPVSVAPMPPSTVPPAAAAPPPSPPTPVPVAPMPPPVPVAVSPVKAGVDPAKPKKGKKLALIVSLSILVSLVVLFVIGFFISEDGAIGTETPVQVVEERPAPPPAPVATHAAAAAQPESPALIEEEPPVPQTSSIQRVQEQESPAPTVSSVLDTKDNFVPAVKRSSEPAAEEASAADSENKQAAAVDTFSEASGALSQTDKEEKYLASARVLNVTQQREASQAKRDADHRAAVTAAPAPTPPPVPAPSPVYADRDLYGLDEPTQLQLAGVIDGSKNITMELFFENNSIYGSYYYDKYRTNISLIGSYDLSGNIELTEYYEGDETGSFEGSFSSATKLGGIWTSGDKKKAYTFSLNITSRQQLDSFVDEEEEDDYWALAPVVLQTLEGIVTGDGVRLRQSPSLKGKIITKLYKNNHVFIISPYSKGLEWVNVKTADQKVGWIHHDYLYVYSSR
ncbi:MAG: M48 family metalloprotease [Candidatus Hydrogenedentales bacterium]|jgi:heat shock protein HtpX